MAAKTKSVNSGLPIKVIAALVTALVLFVGWLAYANLMAPPKTPPMSAEAKAKNDRLKALAQQSGGDMSKLSQEDRDWVNSVTGGYGPMALRGLATNSKK